MIQFMKAEYRRAICHKSLTPYRRVEWYVHSNHSAYFQCVYLVCQQTPDGHCHAEMPFECSSGCPLFSTATTLLQRTSGRHVPESGCCLKRKYHSKTNQKQKIQLVLSTKFSVEINHLYLKGPTVYEFTMKCPVTGTDILMRLFRLKQPR